MPSYQIPPWIRGVDWRGAFASAVQLQQEWERLQQANQLAAAKLQEAQMQFAARNELAQKEAARRDQELAIKAAYEEAMVGLRESALQQQEEKIQQADRKLNAMLKVAQMRANKVPSQISEMTTSSGKKFVQVYNPNTGATSLHPADLPGGGDTETTIFPEVKAQPGQPAMTKGGGLFGLLPGRTIPAIPAISGSPRRIIRRHIPRDVEPTSVETQGEDQETPTLSADDETLNAFLDMVSQEDQPSDEELALATGEGEQ